MEFNGTHQLSGALEVSTLVHEDGAVTPLGAIDLEGAKELIDKLQKYRIASPEGTRIVDEDEDNLFEPHEWSDKDGWEKPKRSPQLDALSRRLLDDLEALRSKRRRSPPPSFT